MNTRICACCNKEKAEERFIYKTQYGEIRYGTWCNDCFDSKYHKRPLMSKNEFSIYTTGELYKARRLSGEQIDEDIDGNFLLAIYKKQMQLGCSRCGAKSQLYLKFKVNLKEGGEISQRNVEFICSKCSKSGKITKMTRFIKAVHRWERAYNVVANLTDSDWHRAVNDANGHCEFCGRQSDELFPMIDREFGAIIDSDDLLAVCKTCRGTLSQSHTRRKNKNGFRKEKEMV